MERRILKLIRLCCKASVSRQFLSGGDGLLLGPTPTTAPLGREEFPANLSGGWFRVQSIVTAAQFPSTGLMACRQQLLLSQSLRPPAVSFRPCIPPTASAPPRSPLAGSRWGRAGCFGKRPGDGQRHARWRPRGALVDGRPEDVAREGSTRGQRPAGKALRRALVRGQALPELRLREAVARLVDSTPTELPPPMPGLPPTPEQLRQARRLAEAGTTELERVKEALEPRRPPAVTKPRVKDPMKAWLRTGRAQPRGGQLGSQRATRGFPT